MKNGKTILLLVLLFILIGGVIYYFYRNGNSKTLENVDNYSAYSTSTNEIINQNSQEQNNLATTTNSTTTKNMEENKNINTVILHTNMGNISFELSKDKPATTQNFIKLASSGFYNGVRFHRVIEGFMIQTGDPLSKDVNQKSRWGTGDPGYKFNDELTGSEKYSIGTVAMANSGPNTNGSQFFIMTSNTSLPPNYTIFGKVSAGIETAMKIQNVKTDANDRPIEDVIINSVELK